MYASHVDFPLCRRPEIDLRVAEAAPVTRFRAKIHPQFAGPNNLATPANRVIPGYRLGGRIPAALRGYDRANAPTRHSDRRTDFMATCGANAAADDVRRVRIDVGRTGVLARRPALVVTSRGLQTWHGAVRTRRRRTAHSRPRAWNTTRPSGACDSRREAGKIGQTPERTRRAADRSGNWLERPSRTLLTQLYNQLEILKFINSSPKKSG